MARFLLAALAAMPLLAMAAPTMAAEYTVNVGQMKFGTIPANLRVGDVIIWNNEDYVSHSTTARDGSFDIELPARAKTAQTLTKAGDFAIYCKYHPGMTGDMAVKKAAKKAAKKK